MLRRQSIKQALFVLLAAAAAYLAVTQFPRIWSPEHRLSDWMVTFVSPSKPVDPDIVLVTIRDDPDYRQSLSSLLPSDRLHLAHLVSCMSAANPRVIGFDMLFDWPDVANASVFEKAVLDAAQHTPIVIGVASFGDEKQSADASVKEIERFAAATDASMGVISLVHSGNQGTVRTALGDKTTIPRMTFASSIAKQSGLPIKNQAALQVRYFRIAWSHPKQIRSDRPVLFTDFGSLDILKICRENQESGLRALFENKIVLVGSQAQQDLHRIPLSTLSTYQDGYNGIEIHATIIAQILRGPNIVVSNGIFDAVISLLAASLGLLIHNHPQLKTWKKFVLVGAGIAITVLTWALYAVMHLLLPLSLLLIALTNGSFVEQAASGTNHLRKSLLSWANKLFGRIA